MTPTTLPAFTDFDCRWVEHGLRSRGVLDACVLFGVRIATRESACCPNVQGGDRTNGIDCTVVRVAEWDHRSDTGAFQLNGVHWKTSAGFVCPEWTCAQADILADPELQLDLFVVLLEMCGEGPWVPPYSCRATVVR